MILYGETYFDMFREPHREYGKSVFMLKRWTRHSIYTKTGSYSRPDNLRRTTPYIQTQSYGPHTSSLDGVTIFPHSTHSPPNLYASMSIYLYDYVLVSDRFFENYVYTSSAIDSVPALNASYQGDVNGTASFYHAMNTWQNSPNAITNNYLFAYNPQMSLPTWQGGVGHAYYGPTVIYRDDGTYFEVVRGYPRNHHIHKRNYFAMDRFTTYGLDGRTVTSASYRKGMQTSQTTIGLTGLSDGSSPIQSTQVTNIDLIKSDNVIYH